MRSYDLAPLYRSTVGFDRLFSLLDGVNQFDAPAYPPYNIERLGENDYRITMAVAGFAPEELNVEVKEGVLTISAKRAAEDKRAYLHQGIAARAFERRFQLADHVEVSGAKLENGLLHLELVRRIPEEKKARRISINATGNGATSKTIEADVAQAA